MNIDDELAAFHERNGFEPTLGARQLIVRIYMGCMLVPLPNIETRHRYLKYHDLHHLVTGYGTGRLGEGEVSAWELGSGSAFVSPTLGLMNLIALSTGLALEPRRMWRAFHRGCASRNLYPTDLRAKVDSGHWPDLGSLRQELLEVRESRAPSVLRSAAFAVCCMTAMVVHAMIAIPAVIAGLVTDVALGYSVFQERTSGVRLRLLSTEGERR